MPAGALRRFYAAHPGRRRPAALVCRRAGSRGVPGLARRPKYEELLRELKVRPLKVQAARGVIVKLTEGDEVEVMASQDMAAATGV